MASEQPWTITFTPETRRWLNRLSQRDAERIGASVKLLEAGGPGLTRPCADSIRGSRHHHMKELRSVGGHLRVLFAFDPDRTAVLLVGGDKAGNWKRWYKENIPKADRLYDRHLRQRGGVRRCRTTGPRTGERSKGRGR